MTTLTPTQELLQLAGDLLEADPVEGNRTHLTTLPHVVWYVSTSYSRKVLNVSLPGSLLATLPKQEARNLDNALQHALHGYAFSAQLSRAGYQARFNARNLDSPLALRAKMMAEAVRRHILNTLTKKGAVQPFTRTTISAWGMSRTGRTGSFTEQPLPLAIGLDEQGLFLAPNRGKALWPDSPHWHGTRKDALADAVLKARLVLDVNMELDVRIEGFDLPALAAVTR